MWCCGTNRAVLGAMLLLVLLETCLKGGGVSDTVETQLMRHWSLRFAALLSKNT